MRRWVFGGVVVAGLCCLTASPGVASFTASARGYTETKILRASDAEASSAFGDSVAMSSDTLVVGADAVGNFVGAAYVLERDLGGTDNWGEVAKLTASDASELDSFGTSVAVSVDTAIVGAPGEDGDVGNPTDRAGAAYVFQRDQGGADNWGEVTKLTASDAEAIDSFGGSVAISGDVAIVGASGEGSGGLSAGAAYVFRRDEGGADTWGEVTKLTASDAQAGDVFGTSVTISGDTVLVGARGKAGATGAVYVIQRDEGGADNWGEVTKLTASDAQVGDAFGASVALSGDSAIVGASEEAGRGAAYVFRRDEGGADNWGEVTKLTASDGQTFDAFGESVAIAGHAAVVGAREESGGPGDPISSAGAAYVYARDEGGADNWGEVAKLTASDAQEDDRFGGSVTIGVDTAIVGARSESGGPGDPLSSAGAAYVFAENSLLFFIAALPTSMVPSNSRQGWRELTPWASRP